MGVVLGVVRTGVLGVQGIGIWDPLTGVFIKGFLGVVRVLWSLNTLLVGLVNNICFLDSRCSWNIKKKKKLENFFWRGSQLAIATANEGLIAKVHVYASKAYEWSAHIFFTIQIKHNEPIKTKLSIKNKNKIEIHKYLFL